MVMSGAFPADHARYDANRWCSMRLANGVSLPGVRFFVA
jgi:hypothetical protein